MAGYSNFKGVRAGGMIQEILILAIIGIITFVVIPAYADSKQNPDSKPIWEKIISDFFQQTSVENRKP